MKKVLAFLGKKSLVQAGFHDFFGGEGYTGFLLGEKTITIRQNGDLYDLIIIESYREESWNGIDLVDIRRLLEENLFVELPR